jgi:DNA-binding transcriptional LysR family regulator
LRGVEDALEHGGGQHDQRRGAEAQAVGCGDHRGAGQRYRASGPPPAAGALAEERRRQHAGVDGRGGDQQAGRARGHHPLPGVEQQLVPGHAGQPAQRDQRQVARPRPAHPQERGGQSRASDFGVLLSLVAAGAGVTLVPELAARRLPPGVRLLPPAEPVTRQIFTVSRRGGDRKPAVRVVLDALGAAAG